MTSKVLPRLIKIRDAAGGVLGALQASNERHGWSPVS